MRLLRTGSTAVVCAIALAYVAPQAAAQQQVTITPGDKAAYQEFLKVCAQPLAAMKKLAASHGETVTDAQIREMFITIPPVLREQANKERLSMTAALREGRASMKKEADDPNSTDPSAKVLAPSMLCWLDLLIAREGGQPAGAASPRPPAPAPATDPDSAPVEGCVKVDERPEGWVGFKNVCDFPVNFTYCASKPKRGTASELFTCETGKFGVESMAANGFRAAAINDAETAFWYSCRRPTMPAGTKFDGSDLTGVCK